MKKWVCSLFVFMFLLPAGGSLALDFMGPGQISAPLVNQTLQQVGVAKVWNTQKDFYLELVPAESWVIRNVQVYVGNKDDRPIPATRRGNLIPGRFPYKQAFANGTDNYKLVLGLVEDLDFAWGVPYTSLRDMTIAVHVSAAKLNEDGTYIDSSAAWAYTGVGVDTEVGVVEETDLDETEFEGMGKGWLFGYKLSHPKAGHFIDSPVQGLNVNTPTFSGETDASGYFDYFPDETVTFSIGDHVIGSALGDKKVTPLDLLPMADTDSSEVINMARLVQSLDSDAYPKSGISISSDVVKAFESAMSGLGVDYLDFSNSEQIEDIIYETVEQGDLLGLSLAAVSAEEAQDHLNQNLDSIMFRKNISKTPMLGSAKAKLNVMGVWFPALKANATVTYGLDPEDPEDYSYDEQVTIEYYDENGDFIRDTDVAKPLVATYTDADPVTGAHDVWAAISRDDGNTWKRKNISRMADRSSFILANDEEFYGHCKKPVFQVKGNKIMISWTSKFARGGKPGYAIINCDFVVDDLDTPEDEHQICIDNDDYTDDDPYYVDDIWGVSGPQRSHDYTDEGYPEVGEVPYSAVWVARGIIATQADVDKGVGGYEGDIVWFKPERLTSGRRDANQVFMGGADGAGFAISWQEDPGGLRPGEAKGPGPGWGGATTNHKTDIWYSYITWGDFAKPDLNFVSGGDPEHDDEDFVGRLKALVPMSLPVRISDNDAVNTDNLMVELNEQTGLPELEDGNFIPITNLDATSDDADGSHRYGYLLEGLWNWNSLIHYEGDVLAEGDPTGGYLYEFTNQQEEIKRVVITDDGRALDGNTGASRPNLFLQTYTKSDGSKSAWAIMAYEETKGLGMGPPDDTGTGEEPQDGSGYDPYVSFPDEGKNAIYHSFDFQNPDKISAGTILNLPETEGETIGEGTVLYAVGPECLGSTVTYDAEGNPIYTCISNEDAGTPVTDWKGDSILAYENARRPRFILQSKTSAFGGFKPGSTDYKEPGNSGTVLIVLYKEGEDGAGRPSDIMARRCVVKDAEDNIKTGNPWSPANFLPGAENVSTKTYFGHEEEWLWVNPDRDDNAKGDGVKVCRWEQPEENLELKSGVNPYEDARAHRGQIRGDFVIMGYSYTPNWAASRNAHDKYDFYIRRSFNGGETWTTDPAATEAVLHKDIFIDPEGTSGAELDEDGNDATEVTKHYEVETYYPAVNEDGIVAGGFGEYEPARNVSLIKNNKTSVIEPRIVAVPGTIKSIKDGDVMVWDQTKPEDKQDRNVFYLAYGTSTNLPDVEKAPEDLFYSFSTDKGTTLYEDSWVVNPESDGNYAGETVTRWGFLAKGDPEQGEVQLRMTPDGSRFYSCWLQEIEPLDPENPGHFEGSDIWFRRIMPIEFPIK